MCAHNFPLAPKMELNDSVNKHKFYAGMPQHGRKNKFLPACTTILIRSTVFSPHSVSYVTKPRGKKECNRKFSIKCRFLLFFFIFFPFFISHVKIETDWNVRTFAQNSVL